MKKIKNNNGFLITCVSCILVLLALCYFGINASSKGTSAATTMSDVCPGDHYSVYRDAAIYTSEQYCIDETNLGKQYSVVASGDGGFVCQYLATSTGFDCSSLDGKWVGTSGVCEASLQYCPTAVKFGQNLKITVTFNANGGMIYDTVNKTEKEEVSFALEAGQTKFDLLKYYVSGSSARYYIKDRDDYKLMGWDTEYGDCSVPSTDWLDSANDIVLKACWNKVYTLIYDANGGTDAPASQSVYGGEEFVITDKKPTRKGYIFKNWNAIKDGTGAVYEAGDTFEPVNTAKKTIYAQWEPIPELIFRAEFNANGGTLNGSNVLHCTTTGISCDVTGLPTASKSGYTFKGWGTSSSCTSGSTGSLTLSGDETYYACYQKETTPPSTPTTYTIIYNANGGTGAPSNGQKTKDTVYTISSTKPTRSGYAFTGWNTMPEGGGASYSPGGTIDASVNYSVTLYAQWTKNVTTPTTPTEVTYTATFDENSGTLNGNKKLSCKTTSGSCSVTGLPTASKNGYTFKGWGTSSSCTSGNTSRLTLTKNTTYYACYLKIDEGGNASENPKTGEITIALIWFVGLVAIGYSFYYFNQVKEN